MWGNFIRTQQSPIPACRKDRKMKDTWIPCDKFLPEQEGIYLVTTANGKVRIDRFFGGAWGLCLARPSNNKGRYRPHKAWCYLPKPYKE